MSFRTHNCVRCKRHVGLDVVAVQRKCGSIRTFCRRCFETMERKRGGK